MELFKKIIKLLKKIIVVISVVFFICSMFAIVFFKFNDYFWEQHYYALKWNLMQQSTFKTENFIIDVPTFGWLGKKDNNKIYFIGIPICLDGLTCKKETTPRIVFESFFNDAEVDALKNEICDKALNKTTKTINNVEADIYECESSNIKCPFAKLIIYKNESFLIYRQEYDDILQSQYDKFFQGVKLKQ
jgi:hypothetical protein